MKHPFAGQNIQQFGSIGCISEVYFFHKLIFLMNEKGTFGKDNLMRKKKKAKTFDGTCLMINQTL